MFNRGQTRFWWSHVLLHLHLHLRHCHRHCHHKSSWTLLSDRFFHRTLAPNKEKCPDPLLWRETWTTIVHDWPIPTHHCYMTSCRFNCSSSTVRSSCASCWVFSREEGRESLYILIIATPNTGWLVLFQPTWKITWNHHQAGFILQLPVISFQIQPVSWDLPFRAPFPHPTDSQGLSLRH